MRRPAAKLPPDMMEVESGKIRILLIEDNPGDARLIKELLTAKGSTSFVLVHADQLSTGLARLAHSDFDVVLLDLSLPDSQGLDGLNKIYAQAPEVPVVVLSGLSDEAVAIQAVQEGAQDYLVKGKVDSDLLVRSLHHAIDRQYLQAALSESEARYRLLADNAADVIWTANMKWQITYVSPSIKRLLGYTVEEMKRLSIRDFLTPDSLKQAGKLIRNQMEILTPESQQPPLSLTLEHVRKDGSKLWAEVMLSFLWNKDGRLSEVMGVTRDITERKKAEEALRASEEYFRALTENSSDAVAVLNRDGTARYERLPVASILGYRTEDLVGRNVFELVHPDDMQIVAESFAKLVQSPGATMVMEVRYRHKDGSWRHMEGMGKNLLNNPAVDGIVVNYRDITERKTAEEKLQHSEEMHRLIFENTNDVIYTYDTEFRITSVSPSVQKLLGYSPSELVGRPFYELDVLAPEYMELALVNALRIFAGESLASLEYVFVAKDGTRKIGELSGAPMYSSDGKVIGAVATGRDITERKQMEEELRLLSDAVSISQDGIAITDLEGKYLEANDATLKMHGVENRADFLGKLATEFIAPEDLGCLTAKMAEALGTGYVPYIEYQCLKTDGSKFTVESSISVIKDRNGEPKGYVAVSRDITERKKMEAALQTSEKLYRLLAENVRDVIWTVDMNLRLTYCSPSITQLTGYSVEEYMLKTVQKILTPTSVEFVTNLFAEELALDESSHRDLLRTRTFEAELICKEGSTVPVEMKVTWIRDADGGPIGLLGVSRDIRDRKSAEQALQQREQDYATLVENLSDAVFKFKDGIVVWCNDKVKEIYGYDKDELLGKDASFFIPEDRDPIEFIKSIHTVIKKDGCYHGAIKAKTKSGGTVDMEYSISQIPNKQHIELVAVARNVTERKQLEEQIQLAGRLAAIGELAAGVAHELNNPLTAIQGFAQLLTNDDSLNEATQKGIQTIYKEAQRATKITDNLLHFARAQGTSKSLICINEALREALELRANQLKVNNIEVAVELQPDLPRTMADFQQMQQVFLNLINNAEQAMLEAHGRGKLLVRTSTEVNIIRITFSDNGPGISAENIKKIFDPFFTTKEVGKGTGLGLSICFGLIQAHGGRIYADSKLGQGSTFIVEIPIIADRS
jgi:PAS domain S-box-containing protein